MRERQKGGRENGRNDENKEGYVPGGILKGAQSRLNGLKSLAKLFNIIVIQSVSIFSILNHPCSFMLCYNLFGVLLSL